MDEESGVGYIWRDEIFHINCRLGGSGECMWRMEKEVVHLLFVARQN